MRPLSALVVAFVVLIGTVPVGVAAAASGDAPTADALTGGVAQAQTNETATPTNDSAETATPTANETTEDSTATDNDSANGSTAEIEPGAQFAGVVAVQGTEVSEEVGSRAFGLRVAAAETNESKATVVADELNATRERLAELRDRRAELEQAHENGEMTRGQYRARIAGMSAEINAIERRLEQTNETSASLPASVREKRGINTSNIQRLRSDASNLSGPETAALARGIAGADAGRGLGPTAGAPGQSGDAPGRNGDAPGRNGNARGPGNATDGAGPANASSGGAAGERGGNNATNDAGGNAAPGNAGDGTNAGAESTPQREGNGNSNGPGSGDAGSGGGSNGGGSGNDRAGGGGGPDGPGNPGGNAPAND